jgi:hypothetical protein
VSELQQQNLAASVLPASSHVNAGAPGTVHRALRDGRSRHPTPSVKIGMQVSSPGHDGIPHRLL